jgi:hypothetical protein
VAVPQALGAMLGERETVLERMLLLAVSVCLERVGAGRADWCEPLLVAWQDATGCAWRGNVSQKQSDG